jgi:hypothetical protein
VIVMGWPLSQDYNEAVQSPASNFADADLRLGKAVTNKLGLPMPCAGNFADVYEVRCPGGGRWAVKCFTRETPGLRERYREISRHLGRAKLPFTVGFDYLEQGIRVAARWYPVLKMRWVAGLTLNQFAARYADDPAMLASLVQVWRRMATRLRAAEVAHGDLQHGNVLLVPGRAPDALALKLIDYDGMWVPALAGVPSGEVGHPAYQHPQRLREATYGPEVDRFPLLLVATALCALKAGGRALWERYDDGDSLLFRREDLEAPGRSPLFYGLLKADDPAVRSLTEKLIDAARKPLDQTPTLEEAMAEAAPAAAVVNAAPPPVPVGAPAPSAEASWHPGESRPAVTEVAAPAFAPAGTEIPQAEAQPEPRRRRIAPFWVALAGAVTLLAGLAGVLALVTRNGGGVSRTGPTHETPQRQHPADAGPGGPGEGDQEPERPAEPPPAAPVEEDGWIRNKNWEYRIVTAKVSWHEARDAARKQGGDLASLDSDEKVNHLRPHLSGHRELWVGGYKAPDGQWRWVNGSLIATQRWGPGRPFEHVPAEVSAYTIVWENGAIGDGGERIENCTGYIVERSRPAAPVEKEGMVRVLSGHQGCLRGVAFLPDGRRALSGASDKTVRLWDLRAGEELRRFVGHTEEVTWVALAPDGTHFASASSDRTVRVWDINSDRALRVSPEFPGPLACVGFFPDGRQLIAVGNGFSEAVIWDSEADKIVRRISVPNPCWCEAFAPGGGNLLALTPGALVWLFAGNDPTPREFKGHTQDVRGVAISPSGARIASSSFDGTVRLWDVPQAREVWSVKADSGVVNCVAFTPDGRRVLSVGGSDRALRLWDAETGQLVRRMEGHKGNIPCVAISPDGRYALTGGDDSTVILWKLPE